MEFLKECLPEKGGYACQECGSVRVGLFIGMIGIIIVLILK